MSAVRSGSERSTGVRADVVPDVVPVLSRGRHRTPRRGACFMEFASFLAGERWSDHPECTHPLLAAVARAVNDHIGDDSRADLVQLIPRVVGLHGDDPRIDLTIALRCAQASLPVARETRQHSLAVGIVACEKALAADSEAPGRGLSDDTRAALDSAPATGRWLQAWRRRWAQTNPSSRRLAARLVDLSLEGLVHACIDDVDDRLHELLAQVIDDCAALVGQREEAPRSVRLPMAADELATMTPTPAATA